MDPVSEEQNEPSYVETQFHAPPLDKDQSSNPDAINSDTSDEEEEVETNKSTAE